METKNIYDNLRGKLSKVLRVSYRVCQEDYVKEKSKYFQELQNLNLKASLKRNEWNHLGVNFIQEEKITANTASSIFNDIDLVYDISVKLIEVTNLLYDKHDSLLNVEVKENNSHC